MANIYVRSTDGSDSDNGSTWALAKATVTGAAGIEADGDTIYVSDNHSESTAGAINPTWSNSLNILCVDDSAEPPTALATTAVVATTGNNGISFISGNRMYVYGLTFTAGNSTGTATITITGPFLESCSLVLGGSGANSRIALNRARALNCGFKFGATGQYINPTSSVIEGGSVLSGGTSPTQLFGTGDAFIAGVDFSNCSSSVNIALGGNAAYRFVLRNCKLPDSWSGSLVSSAVEQAGSRVEMHNCDSGDTNYRLWVEDYGGSVVHSTTVYNNAGATDGTTNISWKMVSNSSARFPGCPLRTPEIVKWNEVTTGTLTASVEVVFDGATDLDNDEIWLEVEYLGTTGRPLSLFADDAAANIFATPAAQANGTATWTGTSGFTNENKHTLSVSFDPKEKGYIHARVCLAKASTTVYVDPLLTVS